jgi:DNA-binding XRE family transcriptional regulator
MQLFDKYFCRIMESTIGQRLEIFIKYLKTNTSKFADEIGMSKSTMYALIDNKYSPQVSTVMKILEKYPELNKLWLFFGEGEMLKSGTAPPGGGGGPSGESPPGGDGPPGTPVQEKDKAPPGKCKECPKKEERIENLENQLQVMTIALMDCQKKSVQYHAKSA